MKDHIEDIEAQGTDLVALPAKEDLPAYFLGKGGDKKDQGIADLVDRLEKPLKDVTHDVSTAKGRKEARSVASDVSKSKTVLEAVRKEITQEWRDNTAKVNAAGKIAVERLDALRDRIKAPAEEFEAKQAEKLRQILLRMDVFKTDVLTAYDGSAELQAKIDEIEAVEVNASFEDQEGEARIQKAAALDKYRSDLGIAESREQKEAENAAQAAELEELRAEKAAREAAEAERLAKEEAERAAEEREKQERLQAEQREQEQREATERARQEAEEQAKREAQEAEERHQRELQAAKEREERAAQAERDRIAQEEADKAAAAAKLAADVEHRSKARARMVQAFVDLGPDGWEAVADALIDGKIPHMDFNP